MKNKLNYLSFSAFLQTQFFMVPFLLLFYQANGLTVGDFFLFQGIFSLAALILDIPMGYLADIFPKKNILILSYVFYIIRLLLWLFLAQYGYWILLLCEIMFAAHKASFTGASDSYVYEYLLHNNTPHKMVNRYGKLNFFMALGTTSSSLIGALIYAAISQYSLQKYNHNYGFTALICIELIFNLIALFLLFQLPKFPVNIQSKNITLHNSYKKLFRCIAWVMKNKNIKYHILYSGLLTAITMVLAWSFQPIMKLLLIPVSLYGFVYFLNHLFRALASLYIKKIKSFIVLSKMGLLIFLLFVFSFIFTFIILSTETVPTWVSLVYFGFVSLTIGGQLVFSLLSTVRLHTLIPSIFRATSASVNTAIGRFYTGLFFVLMKVLLDGISIKTSLIVCFVIFLIFSFLLRKFYCIQKQEEKYV